MTDTSFEGDMNVAPSIGTLMLIDDNKIDQLIYKRIIDRSDNVGETLSFLLAQDALDYLKSGAQPQPDLILLDINMPRMNGFEFLEAATDQLGPDFCPVIVMLTTSLDPRDQQRAGNFAAIKRFLNKPLTQELLTEIARIR